MEFRNEEQLKAAYPMCSISLRVCGNFGELETAATDEAEAVREYERPARWRHAGSTTLQLLRAGKMPRASAVIVRATGSDGYAQYYRGWLDDTRWKWDDDPDSLSYEPINKKKEKKMPDTIDYSEACDYESLRKGIVGVLKRYYATDDVGEPNKEYDGEYTADEAVDDIRKIVGTI